MTTDLPQSKGGGRAGKRSKPKREPFRVRLPGFLSEEQVGLGDVIKRTTMRVGIAPCANCGRRAAALNRRVVFSFRRHP